MIRASSARQMALLCGAFSSVHIVVGLLSLDSVSDVRPPVVAMAAYALATIAVLVQQHGRLTMPRALAALGAVAVMAVLVDSVLPKEAWPGYATWHIAASYTLLAVVNLRGRVLVSWAGAILSVVVTAVWASGTSSGPLSGLTMSIATVGWLAVATGIGHLLRRHELRISQYEAEARGAADRYAADRALTVSRTEWLEHVRHVVAPALHRIASPGFTPTDADRQDFRLVEAQLRDEVQGRALATQEVVEAAWEARRRGVVVHLIDDRRQDLAPQLLATFAKELVAVLDRAHGGTVTARVKPPGSPVAATIYASTPEEPDSPLLLEIADPCGEA